MVNILRQFRRGISSLCIIAATCLFPLNMDAADSQLPDRPNFIVILADDVGWRDLSCYGSTFYETPNIDKLAEPGVRFTNAYAACSVCSPTRAALLTGKYPARLHFTHIIQAKGRWPKDSLMLEPDWCNGLPLAEKTIPEMLKEKGYRSAHIGKWHLGGCGGRPVQEENPLEQGFDLNVGGSALGQPPDYYFPYRHGHYAMTNMPTAKRGDCLTDVLTGQAVNFISENRGRPFFLYMSFYTPHTAMGDRLQADNKLIEKYRNKLKRLPGSTQRNPVYAAMIEQMDNAVGRIINKLKETGLQRKTFVLFMSDNGGYGRKTCNLPLRSAKSSYYEGGIRVPMIASWPGVIGKNRTCDVPVSTVDVFPTLEFFAGIKPKTESKVDGEHLAPLLTGKGEWHDRPLFWHSPHYGATGPVSVVRKGDFKLIEFLEDGRTELYDLEKDLSEQHDLSVENPRKTEELRDLLNEWRKEVNAQIPLKRKKIEVNK